MDGKRVYDTSVQAQTMRADSATILPSTKKKAHLSKSVTVNVISSG